MPTTILGIVGSPRKNSNTEILVKEALVGARNIPGVSVDTKLLLLRNKNIQLCKGCNDICYFGDKPCPIKDDMGKILDELLRVDGYILGTPTYFGGMSGLMRAFMDRTVPIFGKLKYKVAGIISVGGGEFDGQELAAQSIRVFCLNHSMIQNCWHVSATAAKPGEVIRQAAKLAEARKLGQNIVRLVEKIKK